LVGALLVALAHPVVTVAWTSDTFSSSSEIALLRMTNETRSTAGLPALRLDATLVLEARWRSRDMIERAYFSHEIPPDGHRYAHELAAKGYCFLRAGENIGWNAYPDETATRQIHEAFLASRSHRMAILQPDWDAIGVGAYQGPGNQKMWTVLFAHRCPAAVGLPVGR
jgi:uncharacterized protein YkwD